MLGTVLMYTLFPWNAPQNLPVPDKSPQAKADVAVWV